jgi:hypothetical protein
MAWLAGILLLAPSLMRDLQLNRLLKELDTRTIARMWMIQHIAPATPVVMIGGNSHGKPMVSQMYFLVSVNDLDSLKKATKWAKWVVSDSFEPLILWSRGATDAGVAELNSEGKLEFDLDSLEPGSKTPVFDPNDAFYVPFEHITSMVRPGPRIRIWKITGSPGGSVIDPLSPKAPPLN